MELIAVESKINIEINLVSLFQKAQEELVKEAGVDCVPNTILYSEGPNRRASNINPLEFAKKRQLKKYIEDVLVDPTELESLRAATIHLKDKTVIQISSKELLKRHYTLIKKIKLIDSKSAVGVSAFASTDIEKDEMLIYTGVFRKKQRNATDLYSAEIVRLRESKSDNDNHNDSGSDITIDGEEYRGIADFFDSLVTEKDLPKRYVFKDKDTAKKIATENFSGIYIYVTDLDLVLSGLIALRPIKANERLGWDYGDGYWLRLGKEPLLLAKDESSIPREDYQSVSFTLRVKPSNTSSIPSSPVFQNGLLQHYTWKEFRDNFMKNTKTKLIAHSSLIGALTSTDVKAIMEKEGCSIVQIAGTLATIDHYKNLAERFTQLFGEKFKADLTKIPNPWEINILSQSPLVLKPKLPEKNKNRFKQILDELGVDTTDLFKPVITKDNKTVYQFSVPNAQCFWLATYWDLMVKPKSILPNFSFKQVLGGLGLIALGAAFILDQCKAKP